MSAEGAHLPTLESIRKLVQARVDQSEHELARLNAEGIQAPYADGYIAAMGHVLDLLALLAGGRP